MNNAIKITVQPGDDDCITPELLLILETKLQRFKRKKAWAQVSLLMEKGVVKRIRTIQDENISDLLVNPLVNK